MKKRGKQLLTIGLSMVMALSAVGCGSNSVKVTGSAENTQKSETVQSTATKEEESYYNEEGYPICDEPITLSIAMPDDTGLNQDSKRIQLEEYASRLGINLEIHAYSSESYATQLTLMMANDEMYDLVVNSGYSAAEVHDCGEQGYLLDLAQYMELMPNLQKVFNSNLAYQNINTYEDGTMYGLVQLQETTPTKVFIDKNWLENLDLEIPTSVEELYDVLKAFKEKDANGNGDTEDEIPMQYTYCRDFTDNLLLGAFGMTPNEVKIPVDTDENGEVRLSFMSDNYKAYLQYLNKLYTEGLIDQEAFSVSNDIVKQNYVDDKIGFGGEYAPFATTGSSVETDVDVAYAIVSLTSEYSEEPIAVWPYAFSDSNKIMVSANCEYPEAACRFIDYLYTAEGAMSAMYGYEGISFTMKEVPGMDQVATLTVPDSYASQDEYRTKEVVLNSKLNICTPYVIPDSPYLSGFKKLCNAVPKYRNGEMDEETYENLRRQQGYGMLIAEGTMAEGVTIVNNYPPLSYTTEEGEIRSRVRDAISNYLTDTKAQFIIGNLDFEADWDDYINELNSMGAQELLQVEQSAYGRYMAQ